MGKSELAEKNDYNIGKQKIPPILEVRIYKFVLETPLRQLARCGTNSSRMRSPVFSFRRTYFLRMVKTLDRMLRISAHQR